MPRGHVIAVVDAGPLYAAVDADDRDHARSVAVLERRDLQLVVPALVVAEVTYLVAMRLGATIEAAFLRGLASLEIEAPLADEWATIGDLVERYADGGLGGTDASVAVLADRLGTDTIVTLDERHFRTLRTRAGGTFRILPD